MNVCSFFWAITSTTGWMCKRCATTCAASLTWLLLVPVWWGVERQPPSVFFPSLWKLPLPVGYVCIADCTYQATEHMIPIFGGSDGKRKRNDDFNFYASQCRIWIEMAFGLMYKKWGVLWCPVVCNFDKLTIMMPCIACLHNFVINEQLAAGKKITFQNVEYNSTLTLVPAILQQLKLRL